MKFDFNINIYTAWRMFLVRFVIYKVNLGKSYCILKTLIFNVNIETLIKGVVNNYCYKVNIDIQKTN